MPKLNGLNEISAYFRENELPIFSVSPSPYHLLGIEKYVRNLSHIHYYDSFDSSLPNSILARENRSFGPLEWEEITNHILTGSVFRNLVSRCSPAPAYVVLGSYDKLSERLVAEMGAKLLVPSYSIKERLDSKIEATKMCQNLGISSVPYLFHTVKDYASLQAAALVHDLGTDLVIQTPFGDSGRTTFFVSKHEDYCESLAGHEVKVMKRIDHIPGSIEACATHLGTIVGPIVSDITGFEILTPHKGGWAGNDADPLLFPRKIQDDIRAMARAVGNHLYSIGFKGSFCLDFLVENKTDRVYFGEINPRISGITPLTTHLTQKSSVPLFLIHLLEHLEIDYQLDIDQLESTYATYDQICLLLLQQIDDRIQTVTKCPPSGLWTFKNGKLSHEGPSHSLGSNSENEVTLIRFLGVGDVSESGEPLAALVSRGRLQDDQRLLKERAHLWVNQFRGLYEFSSDARFAP